MSPSELKSARQRLGEARELLERHGYKVVPPPDPEALAHRFWAKVDKSDECWLWTAAKDRKGYGLFKLTGSVTRSAHRVSWMLTRGSMPASSVVVMHTCDNPGCVNPAHLKLGTNLENNADKVAKGRHTLGERNGNAKLTADQVRFIRSAPLTSSALGKHFGIAPGYVRQIRGRGAWRHI